MKKPDSLRAALSAIFPEFARDPNRLHLWIEDGMIRCHAGDRAVGENLSFTLEYSLNLWIENWAQETILIWIVVLDWLQLNQPDLLTASKSPGSLPFEADLLSEKATDIGLELKLTESVIATRRPDGGFDMSFALDPDPILPDTMPIVPGGDWLKTIWAEGIQLVPEPLAEA